VRTFARAGDHAAILGRLAALTPGHTRRWGRMNVHQAVCHMADAFRMARGTMPVAVTARWHERTLVKWIALYAPLRWPGGIPTSPELDQVTSCGTQPGTFDADLAALCALAREAVGPGPRVPHPVFGALSEPAWLRWAWLHTDHHLRQFGA
jgi:uncharacterized protein DUF1569